MYDHIGLQSRKSRRQRALLHRSARAARLCAVLARRERRGLRAEGRAGALALSAQGTGRTGAHIAFRAPDHAAIKKFHAEGLKAGGRDNGGAGPSRRLQPDLFRRVPDRSRRQQCRGGLYVSPHPPSCESAIGTQRTARHRAMTILEIRGSERLRSPMTIIGKGTPMASIHKDIPIDAPPDDVWDAVRDFGALHTRLVPGFVTRHQARRRRAHRDASPTARSRANCWSIATTRGGGWSMP